jgi:hypothetical protein
MRSFATIIVILFSAEAYSGEICGPTPVGASEPEELIISEEDYSLRNAIAAYKRIAEITDKPKTKPKGSEAYISRANAEIILKGYILKTDCLLHKNKESCSKFCNHMKKRKYWFD